MLTLVDYYMGRDLSHSLELTNALRANATVTVEKANDLLFLFGHERTVNSGWRPPAINAATPGAATFSRHMTCEAIDLSDPEGDLDQFLLDCPAVLEELKLWMEHPAATKGWTHVQTIAPKSGRRIFYP